MRNDLLAGALAPVPRPPKSQPRILIFDSGVGGLTVHAEVARLRPEARFIYAADDAAFPYGGLNDELLRRRVLEVMERMIARHSPTAVVIACNTASTIALPALRARFAIPFVGAVPAVKPAAAASRSGVVAVLATPGTAARDYTRELIETFAQGCEVVLVGSSRLAGLAEAHLRGETVADADIASEIAPCFATRRGGADGAPARTDVIALACTHFPLLLERFEALSPWRVDFIDSAPAIARRVAQLLGEAVENSPPRSDALAVFTSGAALTPALRGALRSRGFADIRIEAMPPPFGRDPRPDAEAAQPA